MNNFVNEDSFSRIRDARAKDNGYNGIRLSLYLNSNINLSGSGSQTDPYTID